LVIAYFFGSTHSGYLAGNVLRTLGKWPGLMVLVVDVLKGVCAIIVARAFCPWLYAELSRTAPTAFDLQIWVPWVVCLAGIAVLFGIAARFG
jgi:acyl phosphate:glycerol-3-phosphate acyltransferase